MVIFVSFGCMITDFYLMSRDLDEIVQITFRSCVLDNFWRRHVNTLNKRETANCCLGTCSRHMHRNALVSPKLRGSLLCGCSSGWGRSPYRVAERSPMRVQEITRAGVSLFFRFRFESVAYRTPPRALVKFVMHTLSRESSKHSLNC